eukprot:13413312-Ditylum_brightwellii.AAC.1
MAQCQRQKRKYVTLPLVDALHVLNDACAKHYNMTWKHVSGKRYEYTLKRIMKKCEQMLINYYFDEEDVEGEE